MNEAALTPAELLSNRLAAKNDPAIIRAAVAERCKALGLPDEHRIECENHALSYYWMFARSNAWCVSKGDVLAETMAKLRNLGTVPDSHFCRNRERCAGLLRCPCDPVCNN